MLNNKRNRDNKESTFNLLQGILEDLRDIDCDVNPKEIDDKMYTELFEAKQRIKELEAKLESVYQLNYILDHNNDLMKKEMMQLKYDKRDYFKRNLCKYDVEIKNDVLVISNSNNQVIIDKFDDSIKAVCIHCLCYTIGIVKKCCGYSICGDCFTKSSKQYTSRNGVQKPLIAFCSICDAKTNKNFNYDDWEELCLNNLS